MNMPNQPPLEIRAALEAVLIAADQPVDPNLLAQLLEVSTATVEQMCRDLAAEYRQQGRGFTIARVAGGYRYQTSAEQVAYVERFVLEGQSARLSAAAMETLAIVAYRQPITKADIESVRGVNVDAILQKLLERSLIRIAGKADVPGRPLLYATTDLFLEHFGIRTLDDLPNATELRKSLPESPPPVMESGPDPEPAKEPQPLKVPQDDATEEVGNAEEEEEAGELSEEVLPSETVAAAAAIDQSGDSPASGEEE